MSAQGQGTRASSPCLRTAPGWLPLKQAPQPPAAAAVANAARWPLQHQSATQSARSRRRPLRS
eukprot:4838070-Lingulodinium_polyedra.AAC.1